LTSYDDVADNGSPSVNAWQTCLSPEEKTTVKNSAWMLLAFAFLSVACARMAAETSHGPMAANPNDPWDEHVVCPEALDDALMDLAKRGDPDPWGVCVAYTEALDDGLVNLARQGDPDPWGEDVVYTGALDDALVNLAKRGDPNPWDDVIYTEALDDALVYLAMQDELSIVVSDPLAPWNSLMFQFNDKLYFWSMKPVSKEYAAVVASPVGCNVQDVFTNLAASNRLDSRIIQKRVHDENVGQALAVHGVDNGFYVVWPVLCPSTAP
jgi:hypothetical protein